MAERSNGRRPFDPKLLSYARSTPLSPLLAAVAGCALVARWRQVVANRASARAKPELCTVPLAVL